MILPGNTSHSSNLPYRVPQGSVWGPLLFSLYTWPVGDIIRRHDLRFQLYAGDTQVYIRFVIADRQDKAAAVHKVEHCLTEIRGLDGEELLKWMTTRQLQWSQPDLVILSMGSVIKLGEWGVIPSPSARNIGMVLNSGMSMDQQVTHVGQAAYCYLQTISTIRSSWMLSWNSSWPLYSLTPGTLPTYYYWQLRDCLISSLRKVQNAAATMAVRAGRWDQMSPILTRLHWLRIWQRIVYKALVLTSCALHALAPTLDFSSGSPICTWPPPTICRQYGVSCTHIEWRVWWLTLWRGSAKALEFPAPWTQGCQFPVLFWFFFNESSKPIHSCRHMGLTNNWCEKLAARLWTILVPSMFNRAF